MMARLTRQDILNRKLGQEEITLPSGDTALIRGMSRLEGHQINQLDDSVEAEVFALATCLLDPKLTEDEIRTWQTSDAGGEGCDIQSIVVNIQRLSKNGPRDGKELTKSVSRKP